MLPIELRRDIIDPALDLLADLGGPPRSAAADRMLVAICGQEADFVHRVQRSRTKGGLVFDGPARGLWQFELGGGVRGVLSHPATHKHAVRLCESRGVLAMAGAAHEALATDDTLAAGFARLLLWTDPRPLPETQGGGWSCYLRVWRPGKPHPDRWPRCWDAAVSVCG